MLTLENLGPRVNDSWDSDPSENPAFILDFGFMYGESFVSGIFKLDFDLGEKWTFFWHWERVHFTNLLLSFGRYALQS